MFKIYNQTNIIFSIIFLLNIIIYVYASLSGFYVDNGIDQTVKHDELTDDVQQEVEHEILELLGLPDRPMKHVIHPSLRKSAQKFLMDVYRRLTDEANGISSRNTRSILGMDDDNIDENQLSDEDERAIHQSDIIMTFLNKNHHVKEVRHERGRRLWFDVSEISEDLILLMAELRMYQNPKLGKWEGSKKTFTITVYSIIRAEGQKELEILSTTNTTADYHGWIELNVTDGLIKWISDKNQNKGLYIGAHSIDKPDHEVKLDNIGLVNTKGDDEYQPFMVGYFKGHQIIQTQKHSRAKRSTMKKSKKKSDAKNGNPFMELSRPENQKSCKIQTLYVSFKDLNWHDWIIAPDGYGAFYCSGDCNFPLNSHMNATNHAIVQTLVHLLNPTKVPKVCCAPTKLSPISVLYFLDETNVNLKKYKNMVVKSCGCH